MELEFSSLSSDELITLYHRINSELAKQFLNKVPWEEQQERIKNLSKISIELNHRNVESKQQGICSVDSA